ncbi:enoyl-CoA hydratase/isomerase family protein [Arthrobacter sp. KNU40]|uniref:enoyl-CoA hydratase/isomerase family protein n=1 Tax=Arthrobacter sp. KNU40 TaxID=3447965 RepID=UPI003F5F7DCB
MNFEDYSESFEHVAMKRTNGVLEFRVHTDGGPLQWGPKPHHELARAFRAVAQDPDNRIMILTGTGDAFSGPRAADVSFHSMPAADWDEFHFYGTELMDSLLSIGAVVISAVNGPALRHCELALMSDIVICSNDTEFQDSGHFPVGLTPGDGINVLTPHIMGLTRSRYFHLTGQSIGAQQALEWGLVNEVVEAEQLLNRAYELAALIGRQKPMVIRHTRQLFTLELRKKMIERVGYGLALEGMGVADDRDRNGAALIH